MIDHVQLGDKVTMPIWTKRRWYELWKPKWRQTVQTFTVTMINRGDATRLFEKTSANG